jgi:hypothetical protein
MGLFENRIKSLEEAAIKVLNEYAPASNPFLRSRQPEVSTMQDRETQLGLQSGMSKLFGGGSLPTKVGGLMDIGKAAYSGLPGYGPSSSSTPGSPSGGFGGLPKPQYVAPSNVPGRTTPSTFKSYGSEEDFFERMATLRSKDAELRRARTELRKTATGDKTSGSQTDEYKKKLSDLRGQEVASREEAQFLRAQRGRERSREMTQKGIEQARRTR